MTRIIGLDLSIASTGIAVPDGTTMTLQPRVVDLGGRLNQLGTDLWRILEPEQPQLAVIEGYSLHSPGPLGMVRRAEWVGCVRRDLRRMGRCPIVEVPPAQLKIWATGHGNADKAAMVDAARAAGGDPANHDEADAYLLWAIGRLVVDGLDLFNDPADLPRRIKVADDLAWPDIEELAHAG